MNVPYVKTSNKMLSDLTSGSNMNGWIPNFLRLSALSRERQVPLITQSGKALFSELTRARPEYPSPKMKTWEGVTSALWIWVENFSLLASVVRFVDAIWIKSSKVMLAGQNASHGIILIVDVKRADREIIFVDSDCKHIWLANSVDSSHFNHLTVRTHNTTFHFTTLTLQFSLHNFHFTTALTSQLDSLYNSTHFTTPLYSLYNSTHFTTKIFN